ncbi:MAG: 4-alpha-glucanotransferase [Candidatus Ryanbacteria bacterium CG10_big_fil_rev_8_21_14_0_10_43_42]|uniref:4-alpha-glucanotransferase n=1 Tax=Candidatus Ryanbacteria bacterium CG10_big_fil_rev_8_21_14_0_10_43_42 TaxID=1974864 RepID=A0A2M8KW41_9BACT|nr:MAG: 4-alpha-glucanotransferase [Candidatus Ryanbacteria bacterium CG10_big_fil_rev_8_21_14_0_10_43_42]
MKVLMFGWELPPHNSGGLGTACAGLARALTMRDIELTFVLPRKVPIDTFGYRIIFAADQFGRDSSYIPGALSPYATTPGGWAHGIKGTRLIQGGTFINEVERYKIFAGAYATRVSFDVIHAHDWLSIPAGIEAKRVSGKPLVVHIHATEFDRTGNGNINQYVYEIERMGIQEADRVIAVSWFTKNILVNHYGADPDKIMVVHNGVDVPSSATISSYQHVLQAHRAAGKKIVLYVGRLTLQKGPDYFLRAAKDVLEREKNVLFVMVGSGDMEQQLIEEAARFAISDRFLFTGFLRGNELGSVFTAADLFVMPSVSEPFGIVPLESLIYGVPVLISKQSGISEVLRHALKVDFWDKDDMVNSIISVIRHQSLHATLSSLGRQEAYAQSWERAAEKCLRIYDSIKEQSITTV